MDQNATNLMDQQAARQNDHKLKLLVYQSPHDSSLNKQQEDHQFPLQQRFQGQRRLIDF